MAEMLAVGLMSGTSMDGIDAALLRTDGDRLVRPVGFLSRPYDPPFRTRLQAHLGRDRPERGFERDLTRAHADLVTALLARCGRPAADIAVIGFHGHTLWHRPDEGRTCQCGDGGLLAQLTGIDVVADLRSADMAAGGQGAPLAPIYHAALARDDARPLAVLNLGGVANVTYLPGEGDMLAFDTGPANALIDDWCRRHTGETCDWEGRLAAEGRVDEARLAAMLARDWFDLAPPKSLDRDDFDLSAVDGLSPADGAATLTAFTVACIVRARAHLPEAPRRWLVTGGGRHNPVLMAALGEALNAPVEPVEAAGWRGDALEAEAFAYMAVRRLRGLPTSLPSTTGCHGPTVGGVLHPAPSESG